jgi:hypothetical protein
MGFDFFLLKNKEDADWARSQGSATQVIEDHLRVPSFSA